ncbi:MAG: TetR/AcrR family transcriptional regulator [Kofleriaceae bacterium]
MPVARATTPRKEPLGTRQRILRAALRLFRQRGYHGVGINEILAIAKAPKGSLYHHFPGGKDQIATEVLEMISERVVEMIQAEAGPTTAEVMRGIGARLWQWMQSTAASGGDGACAVIAALAAEGDTAPPVALAARRAYERIAAALAQRLERQGLAPRAARERALLAIATLEGGGLVSQTMGEPSLFLAAVERAASLCEVASTRKGKPS